MKIEISIVSGLEKSVKINGLSYDFDQMDHPMDDLLSKLTGITKTPRCIDFFFTESDVRLTYGVHYKWFNFRTQNLDYFNDSREEIHEKLTQRVNAVREWVASVNFAHTYVFEF